VPESVIRSKSNRLWPWLAASVAIHGLFLLWPETHDKADLVGSEHVLEIALSTYRAAEPVRDHPRQVQQLLSMDEKSDSPANEAASEADEEISPPVDVVSSEERVPSSAEADVEERESIVRNHLERFKYYPASAKRRGIVGEVAVAFKLDAGGRAGMLKILSASGYRILDDAALETVHRAEPFPADSGAFQVRLLFRAS